MRDVLRAYYLTHAVPPRRRELPAILSRLRELAERAQAIAGKVAQDRAARA